MVYNRIESNPKIMFGKPVIKGTRIPVEHILRKLSGGMTFDAIRVAYPRIQIEDIYAAVAFAADYLASEEIIFADGVQL